MVNAHLITARDLPWQLAFILDQISTQENQYQHIDLRTFEHFNRFASSCFQLLFANGPTKYIYKRIENMSCCSIDREQGDFIEFLSGFLALFKIQLDQFSLN